MICLPKSVDPNQLLNTIRELSWDVGKVIKYYEKKISPTDNFKKKLNIKDHISGPVTDADLEINKLIKNRIKEKYPYEKWDFLSEEDEKLNFNKDFKSKWVWIIDPLDGTKDFINQTGEYAMHLALK